MVGTKKRRGGLASPLPARSSVNSPVFSVEALSGLKKKKLWTVLKGRGAKKEHGHSGGMSRQFRVAQNRSGGKSVLFGRVASSRMQQGRGFIKRGERFNADKRKRKGRGRACPQCLRIGRAVLMCQLRCRPQNTRRVGG